MSTQYQDQDFELLSAYIDGALSDSERVTLEQRLKNDPALQADLGSLRQTVALIQQLPPRQAPRDFTLPASHRRRTLPFPLTPVFSALSTAAAMLLFIFGGYFLLRSSVMQPALMQTAMEAPAAQQQATAVAMNLATETVLPGAAANRIQATPSPLPTQAPPTPASSNAPSTLMLTVVPTIATPQVAEESRYAQGEGNLALQAPPADADGEDQADSLGFAAPEMAESGDDNAGLFRDDTEPAPTATRTVLHESSTGASAVEPETEAFSAALATPTTEAVALNEAQADSAEHETEVSSTPPAATPTAEAVVLDEVGTDIVEQVGQEPPPESAARQALTTPISPIVGLALLVLGAIFTLTAVATTLLRRRQRR